MYKENIGEQSSKDRSKSSTKLCQDVQKWNLLMRACVHAKNRITGQVPDFTPSPNLQLYVVPIFSFQNFSRSGPELPESRSKLWHTGDGSSMEI